MKKKSKTDVKEKSESYSRGRSLFNNIYFFIVLILLIGINGYFSSVITTAGVSYNAINYYDNFEENLDMYEKLDFKGQKILSKFFITKYTTYDVFKKNLIDDYKKDKKENKDYLNKSLYEKYEKYGETAIKAYYYSFVEPQYIGLNTFIIAIIFGITLVIMQVIYKYFSIRGIVLFSVVGCFIASLLILVDTNVDIYIIIPAIIIMLVNSLINYFVFDRKKVKKS